MAKKTNFSSRMMLNNNNNEPVLSKQAPIIKATPNKTFSFQGLETNVSKKKENIATRFSRGNAAIEKSSNDEANLITDYEEAKQIKKEYDKSKKIINIFKSNKFADILFIVGCIYLILLIFGVFVTEYKYNDKGVIEAQKLSYEDIVIKESFEELLDQYVDCRDLYEKVLIIDANLAIGNISPMTLAPEYESIVTEAELLYTKTEALPIEAQYEQIRTMLLEWLKNGLATYCKNMSSAISQNNESIANTALTNRETTYSSFSLITKNLVAMGENLVGVDLVNIKEWDAKDVLSKHIK